MKKKKEKSHKKSRWERLREKHTNTLRCEWCNKYTLVSSEKFNKLWRDKAGAPDYIFSCDRERCKKSRPDV